MKHQATRLIWVLFFLSSCAKPLISRYTLVLVQDSNAQTSFLASPISYSKVARLAIKRFNGKTDIRGRSLELEILDLAKEPIDTPAALEKYINRLEYKGKMNAQQQRSLIVGFVAVSSTNLPNQSLPMQRFVGLIRKTQQVLLGHWPAQKEPKAQQQGKEATSSTRNSFVLNTAIPDLDADRYLQKYIQKYIKGQKPGALYIVHDAQNRSRADDFVDSLPSSQNITRLLYVRTGNNYAAGRIQSVGDLLRNQRTSLQNANSGILLFLSQQNADETNRYLTRSIYRSLFDKIDFILNGEGLALSALPPANSPRYFVFRQFQEADRQQKYEDFRYHYQKDYQLKAEEDLARLFDEVRLLAYSAKQTIEQPDFDGNLALPLYENLLQNRFSGIEGRILFDDNGRRLAVYQVLQLKDGRLEPQNILSDSTGIRQ